MDEICSIQTTCSDKYLKAVGLYVISTNYYLVIILYICIW